MADLTVDSSVFVSNFHKNDSFHRESREFFGLVAGREIRIVIPALVVVEVMHILTHRRSAPLQETVSLHDSFYESGSLRVVSVDRPLTRRFLEISPRLKCKAADALIVATAVLHQTTLITWDRQMILQCRPVLHALTPSEFLHSAQGTANRRQN